ncbi:MAG: IclR family transcriptional regulator [Actinomycetota bacterium]|nr:IclR family transcriptional regulator [Actinomycetota bacterium]
MRGAAEPLVPAVARAASILELLAARPEIALGPTELARRLRLPKSSVANLCLELAEAGLLRRTDGGYRLGRKLVELGGAYLSTAGPLDEFYQACPELEVASRETMQLAVLEGLDVVYVARHDGAQPVRLASEIGRRLPATCTALGKAALASLDSGRLKERLAGVSDLPALTPNSHRTVEALLADLEVVRERGYAVDDEETMLGIVCYAVAIPSRQPGESPYGASVTLFKARVTDPLREALVADLRRLAGRLSHPLRRVQAAGSR